jgi:hypothetical protein
VPPQTGKRARRLFRLPLVVDQLHGVEHERAFAATSAREDCRRIPRQSDDVAPS